MSDPRRTAIAVLTGGYRTGFLFSLCAVGLAVAPLWTVPALRNFR